MSCPREVHSEEVGKDELVDLAPAGGEWMIIRQRLTGAGFDPHLGPIFGPVAFRVHGREGRKDRATRYQQSRPYEIVFQ